MCEKNGIQLLHIFEDEWVNQKEIVKSIIKFKLGIIDTKIFAKTTIKEIDTITCNNFLNNNNIHGAINCKIRIGLFYRNDLVSVMTFRKNQTTITNKVGLKSEWELCRFCNKLNTEVIDGASKLLKYFIKNYQPKSILTLVNRRYGRGDLYKQLGFKFKEYSKINYWYYPHHTYKKYHKYNFRKSLLIKQGFDPNKTELQIMKERNFLILYDCGNIKFELKLQ